MRTVCHRSRRSRSSAANLEVETSVAETPLLIPPREPRRYRPDLWSSSYREFSDRRGDAARGIRRLRGTCKFIRRENTSSTIEKSPACNGRFSMIGSSGHLDETFAAPCPIRGRIFADFSGTMYTLGDFLRDFVIEKEGTRARIASCDRILIARSVRLVSRWIYRSIYLRIVRSTDIVRSIRL